MIDSITVAFWLSQSFFNNFWPENATEIIQRKNNQPTNETFCQTHWLPSYRVCHLSNSKFASETPTNLFESKNAQQFIHRIRLTMSISTNQFQLRGSLKCWMCSKCLVYSINWFLFVNFDFIFSKPYVHVTYSIEWIAIFFSLIAQCSICGQKLPDNRTILKPIC